MWRVFKIFAPLGAIFSGIILKLALSDEIPKDSTRFLIDNYAKPFWIDLIVASAVMISGVCINQNTILDSQKKGVLMNLLFIVFAFCLSCVLIFPKFQIKTDFTLIWSPMYAAFLLFGLAGYILDERKN